MGATGTKGEKADNKGATQGNYVYKMNGLYLGQYHLPLLLPLRSHLRTILTG